MPTLVLMLAFAGVLAGSAAVLWFVIHAWVAGRMGKRLSGGDFGLLAAGLAGLGLGIAGLVWAARQGGPAASVEVRERSEPMRTP